MSDDMQFAVIGAVFGSALTLFIIVTWARSITRNQRQQIEQGVRMLAALDRIADHLSPKPQTKPASIADDPVNTAQRGPLDRVDRVRGMLRNPDE